MQDTCAKPDELFNQNWWGEFFDRYFHTSTNKVHWKKVKLAGAFIPHSWIDYPQVYVKGRFAKLILHSLYPHIDLAEFDRGSRWGQ